MDAGKETTESSNRSSTYATLGRGKLQQFGIGPAYIERLDVAHYSNSASVRRISLDAVHYRKSATI